MVGAVVGGDEAEPVAGAADAEAERRIRRHTRRDTRWSAALERNAHEMAELDDAGDRASRAIREGPQPPGPHVPRVELEGAGRHVAGDEAARRRVRGDIDA